MNTNIVSLFHNSFIKIIEYFNVVALVANQINIVHQTTIRSRPMIHDEIPIDFMSIRMDTPWARKKDTAAGYV